MVPDPFHNSDCRIPGMSTTVLRIAAVLFAIGASFASLEIYRKVVAGRESPSLPAVCALSTAVVVAVVALIAAVAPHAWWRRSASRLEAIVVRLRSTDLPTGRRYAIIAAFIGATVYFTVAVWLLEFQSMESASDQRAFLKTASEIRASGGVPELVMDLYRGEFSEANRHPLYLAMLSMWPTFEFGRRLSIAIGFFTVVLTTALIGFRYGWATAAVFAALLGVNAAFCSVSTLVVCDGLMVLFGGLVWISVVGSRSASIACAVGQDCSRGGPSPVGDDVEAGSLPHVGAAASVGSARPTPWEETPGRPLLTGTLLGLAWLTKGTGLILAIGLAVWIVLRALRRRRRKPSLGADQESASPDIAIDRRRTIQSCAKSALFVAAVWFVVASPLWVRNVRKYGSPTYNVNTFLMFVDEYEDPVELARRKSAVFAAARDYLGLHTPSEIAGRFTRGVVWESFILLRSLGPAPFEDGRLPFGLVIAAFAVVGAASESGGGRLLLLVWIALFLPLFGWYAPIAAGDRFVLPLLVPILAYAAVGIVRTVTATRTLRKAVPRHV